MKKFLWIFALILTLAASVYQCVTDPTHPVKAIVDTGIQKFQVKLLRSNSGKTDCPIVLEIPDITVNGSIYYRKYPTKDEMVKLDLKREGDKLVGYLPNQPPAGKLEYRIELSKNGNPIKVGNGNPVVIRYSGAVPQTLLYIHIFLIFLAMFLSNISGLLAIFKLPSYKTISIITFVFLIIGGLILGPMVQKYAFNEWWTGAPFGWDLTDNKTLIAILVWLWAMLKIRSKSANLWIIAASLITIVIFAIPQSLWGSELNQETGKIIQGNILPFVATYFR